ncbi:hypothetical protein V8C35DRAFT_295311 [Trichoderma chlorosporum]
MLHRLRQPYTKMGELDHAFAARQEETRICFQANSDRIGNSYSKLASLLLRMGRPKEAEETLAKCPSLKDFAGGNSLNTGNPPFSGDVVLLSRISPGARMIN